jgi:hypothetical protein
MSKPSRIVGTLGATALVAGSALGLAAPAAAAANPSTITVTCSGSGGGPYSLSLSSTSVSMSSGDTFTLTNSSGTTMNVTLPNGASFASGGSPLLDNSSATITATSSGSVSIQGAGAQAGGNCLFSSRNLGLSLGSGGSSSIASIPAPVVQQYGKPASGTCDAAQPAGLDWAGVASGGWANSWSQWLNSGSGGFVCTRTLVYSATQAKWVVA